MKKILALALIVGLIFAGFWIIWRHHETNKAAQIRQEKLVEIVYKINLEAFTNNLKHLAGVKDGESTTELFLRFCKQNDFEIKSPESIALVEKQGMLFAKATEIHQKKIERLV